MAGVATSSERFTPGARVGDYHIERELGEDATGIIYLATHVVLPRQAHLKVSRGGARAAAIHLLREACILEALARPGHPGIPHVHECGVLGDRIHNGLPRHAGKRRLTSSLLPCCGGMKIISRRERPCATQSSLFASSTWCQFAW